MTGLALNNRLLAIGGGAKPAAASEAPREDAAFGEVLGDIAAEASTSSSAKAAPAGGEAPLIRFTFGFPVSRTMDAATQPAEPCGPASIESALASLDYAAPASAAARPKSHDHAATESLAPTASSAAAVPDHAARFPPPPISSAAPSVPTDVARILAAAAVASASPPPAISRAKSRDAAAPEAVALTPTPLSAVPEYATRFPAPLMPTAAPANAAPILALAAAVASAPPPLPTSRAANTAPAADALGWDLSGAVPLGRLLASDPTLGPRSLQPRTHLAVANAIPVRASVAQNHSVAATTLKASSNADVEAPSPAAVAPPPVASDPNAPAAINLPRLPQFVADRASEFAQPAAPASAPAALKAPAVVKELEIAMDPVDLGAVTLKLRLANGKLSVAIAAAKPSTLAAIESQRGAIADRLSASRLAPEDLVIQPQAASPSHAETADAPDANANQALANGQSNPRGEGRAFPGSRRAPAPASAPTGEVRGDLGDLMV